MFAKPARLDVWFAPLLVAHSQYPKWRALVDKEGGRIVPQPARLNGLCVVDVFEGEVFENLAANRTEPYRIIGLPCFLSCLKERQMMRFDEHTTPIYSLALKGMVITSTGIGGDELALLQRRIIYLGGVFTLELSMMNTHLIAGRVDGPKWKASVDTRRPILKPSYIKDTWAQQTKDPTTHLPRIEEAAYVVSPFANLTLCVTGLGPSRKTHVQDEARRIGAGYETELSRACTHLISRNFKRSEKTEAAKLWGIPLVSLAWLSESAANGAPLPVTNYLLLEGQGGVTTGSESDGSSVRSSPPQLLLKSLLKPNEAPKALPPPPLVASPLPVEAVNVMPRLRGPGSVVSAAPATVAGSLTKSDLGASALFGVRFACVGFDSSEEADIGDKLAESGALLVPAIHNPAYVIAPHGFEGILAKEYPGKLVTTQFVQRCIEARTLLSPDQCFIFSPLSVPLPCSCFASVTVFTHGFSDTETRSLALAIKTLGARHFRRVTPVITHAVCRGPPPPLSASIPVVSPKWLLRSALEGRLLPPEDFAPEAENPQLDVPSKLQLVVPPVLVTAPVSSTVPPASTAVPASSSLSAALERLAATESERIAQDPPPMLRSRLRSYAPQAVAGRVATRASLEEDDVVLDKAASPPPSQLSVFMDVKYDAPLRLRGSPSSSAPKCFIFSNVISNRIGPSDQRPIRAEIEAGILKLRGDVLDGKCSWSERATHVVTSEPKNTLKFLCAIASCSWVVRPEYITASVAAGRWLREADYEWSPEQAKDQIQKDLLLALRYWRKVTAAEGKRGVFAGWRVLLLMQGSAETYATLLRAGGAMVELDAQQFVREWNAKAEKDKDKDTIAVVCEDASERAAVAAQCDVVRAAGIPVQEQQFILTWLETVGNSDAVLKRKAESLTTNGH